MNPGTGLVRRIGLKPGRPLTRHTPLKAAPLTRTTPLKAARPKVTAVEQAARPPVTARSGGWCEVRIPGVCQGRATNFHHRQNRSQGGSWRASNGVHVCGSGTTGCHGVLTNTNGHRAEYEAAGWIVRSRMDPAVVPVLIAGQWVLLDDAGGCVAVKVAS